jgi:hypothetical protein
MYPRARSADRPLVHRRADSGGRTRFAGRRFPVSRTWKTRADDLEKKRASCRLRAWPATPDVAATRRSNRVPSAGAVCLRLSGTSRESIARAAVPALRRRVCIFAATSRASASSAESAWTIQAVGRGLESSAKSAWPPTAVQGGCLIKRASVAEGHSVRRTKRSSALVGVSITEKASSTAIQYSASDAEGTSRQTKRISSIARISAPARRRFMNVSAAALHSHARGIKAAPTRCSRNTALASVRSTHAAANCRVPLVRSRLPINLPAGFSSGTERPLNSRSTRRLPAPAAESLPSSASAPARPCVIGAIRCGFAANVVVSVNQEGGYAASVQKTVKSRAAAKTSDAEGGCTVTHVRSGKGARSTAPPTPR